MKQTIVLCGGPDKSAKSTILKELQRLTGIPYFKASNEHLNFVYGQEHFVNELRFGDPKLVDFLKQTGYSVLVDRAYMCEFVYSQFYERGTDMHMLRKLDEQFANLGTKIVICTRKSFAGINDDLDPRIDEKALLLLSDLYDQFIEWTNCDVMKLYVDDHNLSRQTKEILEFIGA